MPQAISSKWSKGSSGPAGDEVANLIAHALRADGFDASEDGTGRGTPLVPVACFDERQVTSPDNRSRCEGDISPTMHKKPFTLAIRGRGDSHDLEYRQDGTANAILTPNGGRAGIGVGAVAYPISGDAASGRTGDADTPSADAEGLVRLRPPSLGVGPDGEASFTVTSASPPAVAFSAGDAGNDLGFDQSPTLRKGGDGGGNQPAEQQGMAVRRLTPRECERLQGFPDDYTLVPYRNKPAADGPRYKALGNSMAVPCMAWIGKRLQMVSDIADHVSEAAS